MKKKILILSLFLLIATGCDVTYQVEIYNDKFTEEAILNAKNNEYIDEFQTTAKDSLEGALTEYKQSAGDDDVKVKDQSSQEDIELFVENNGKITEYGNSVLLKNCFELVNVLSEEDQYVLATSKGATCFDQFLNMDKLTIRIKTNHKVISHNADKKQLHTYIWEIDKNNASDKINADTNGADGQSGSEQEPTTPVGTTPEGETPSETTPEDTKDNGESSNVVLNEFGQPYVPNNGAATSDTTDE